jgi:glycine cleavage system H protein
MSTVKEGYYYTKDHEWVKFEGKKAKIGISDYAQSKLGDITFVEPPKNGLIVKQGETVASVESVKAASDIYAPVTGKIVAFNNELENAPELINSSPYTEGWIVEIEIEDENEKNTLFDATAYREYIKEVE